MINPTPQYRSFVRHTAKKNLTYKKAMAIFEGLFLEAKKLGVITSENIWDGFETDLRIAKALNSLR